MPKLRFFLSFFSSSSSAKMTFHRCASLCKEHLCVCNRIIVIRICRPHILIIHQHINKRLQFINTIRDDITLIPVNINRDDLLCVPHKFRYRFRVKIILQQKRTKSASEVVPADIRQIVLLKKLYERLLRVSDDGVTPSRSVSTFIPWCRSPMSFRHHSASCLSRLPPVPLPFPHRSSVSYPYPSNSRQDRICPKMSCLKSVSSR